MNKNCKLLPNFNQLFLQRQSYTSHKRKVIEIRNKKPKPTIRQQLSRSRQSSSNISMKSSKVSPMNRDVSIKQLDKMPPIILQRCHSMGNSMKWMSPYQKIKQQQQMKENQRLKKRIQTSKSEFRKQKLNRQYDKFAKIKERLMKYEVNPQSKKIMLKCEKRLNYLSQNSKEQVKSCTQKDTDKKRSRLAQYLQNRKQSNFSMFAKRTDQLKNESFRNRFANFESKLRPLINYPKMQKNLHIYNRRLRTQSSSTTIKLETSSRISRGSKADISNSKYFALTQIDI